MTTSDQKGRAILFVHGRDFKPDEEHFRDISFTAIRAGIERDYPDSLYAYDAVAKDLAYYGDLTNALLAAAGQKYDAELDLGDRRNALATLRAIPARKRFGIRQYDRLPGKSAIREFVASIAAPVAGAVGLEMTLFSSVGRDFAAYLGAEGEYAENVRARIRGKFCALLDQGSDIFFIAHGLGCIAAYEVLWELSHDARYADTYGRAKIHTWLTLGSPLGDNALRRHLKGRSATAKERFPANIISWYNVAAEDDYMCHDKTVANDFNALLKKHAVSEIKDYRIYNHAVRFGKSNPHSSVGYLIHPRVSKIVADWVNAEQTSDEPVYII